MITRMYNSKGGRPPPMALSMVGNALPLAIALVLAAGCGDGRSEPDGGPDADAGVGDVWHFGRDDVGRPLSSTRPDGEVLGLGYDANGNVIFVTPPGRASHAFTYDSDDLMMSYTPPVVGAASWPTEYIYDLDQQPTSVSYPDGSSVVPGYDAAGRLVSLTTPLGDTTYDYSPDTGQLVAIAAPDGEALDLTWDGFLPESITWSGTVRGTVRWEYGDDLRPTGVTVAGVTVPTTFDDDDMLTGAGDLTVTRDPASGLPEAAALGGVSTTTNFDEFAQLTASSAAFGADELFSESFELDALGRITAVDERVQGEAVRREHHYDAAGRLEEVREDGAVVGRYEYDENGNRTSIEHPVSGEVIDAEHDAQDRLVRQGTTTFEWNERGSLVSRTDTDGTTHYDFDVMGALRSVTLPDDREIGYVIDPAGRRIGRRVDGVLERGWLYGDALHPVAELDGTGRVVSRFVYGTRLNVPEYMVRGGRTYRIVSDVRGSVRLVVDAATGEVAQRLDYDAWGNVVLDTSPGFQPFGFAGGLYDADTGLVRFGARDYDPVTGRWTARDPILFGGGQANLYAYVNNDPVNFTDPSGLAWYDDYLDLQGTAEFIVGWGDAWSFGLGAIIRHAVGLGDVINECSWSYGAGSLYGLVSAIILMRGAGANTPAGGAQQTARVIDPNKLHHIFGQARHNLGPLVQRFGSQEATFTAVESATQAAVESQGLTGVFETTVSVAGQNVVVRGNIMEGVARIATFFIP